MVLIIAVIPAAATALASVYVVAKSYQPVICQWDCIYSYFHVNTFAILSLLLTCSFKQFDICQLVCLQCISLALHLSAFQQIFNSFHPAVCILNVISVYINLTMPASGLRRLFLIFQSYGSTLQDGGGQQNTEGAEIPLCNTLSSQCTVHTNCCDSNSGTICHLTQSSRFSYR